MLSQRYPARESLTLVPKHTRRAKGPCRMMESLSSLLPQIAVAAALVLILAVATEVGFRVGVRHQREKVDTLQLGTIQGATLGLQALLLGFAFSGATSRFIERQDIILREANAIGTADLRADLLPEPARTSLKKELRTYTDERLAYFAEGRPEKALPIKQRLIDCQGRMWAAAAAGVEAKPQVMVAVLPPVNEVIDLLATWEAASSRHLPNLVLTLILTSAALSVAIIGYGFGINRKRHSVIAGTLCLLLSAAMWISLDMDYPRRGLIRMDAQPLQDLQQALKAPAAK